ncbi:MAG: hypothetical protein PF487_07140, partial [Bacteroidales bacterium]|nr:hypothetical protein [Bacteroidales bacterium]
NILWLIGIFSFFIFLTAPIYIFLAPLVIISIAILVSLGAGVGIVVKSRTNISVNNFIKGGFITILILSIITFGKTVFNAENCENAKNSEGEITQSSKDTCYEEKAKRKKDNNICENIISLNERNSCYSEIVLGSGWRKQEDKNKETTSQCDKIKNDISREYCYSQVAIDTFNVNICYDLKNLEIKNFCKERTKHSKMMYEINLCDKMQKGNEQDLCYAKAKNNQNQIENKQITSTGNADSKIENNIIFDVDNVWGKNIDELTKIYGEPTLGTATDPSQGTATWKIQNYYINI